MLSRREDNTRCTVNWLHLHQEYGLGRLDDKKVLHWSRNDLKQWQDLIESNRAAHEAVEAGVDRTTVAKHTANEKLTKTSIQDGRLFCHAINAPIFLFNGELSVHSDVEYRVHHELIDINRYAACLIIENLESYVYCHRFVWPNLPATLVLYRGHDKAVKSLHALLKRRKKSMDVYMFPDTDPAGLGIAISFEEATHIIAPDVQTLDPMGLLHDRFAVQLNQLPNLQSNASGFSAPFQLLVKDLLQTGTAVSQEWLCAHRVPLESVPIR